LLDLPSLPCVGCWVNIVLFFSISWRAITLYLKACVTQPGGTVIFFFKSSSPIKISHNLLQKMSLWIQEIEHSFSINFTDWPFYFYNLFWNKLLNEVKYFTHQLDIYYIA
jgi:hypothetical protein